MTEEEDDESSVVSDDEPDPVVVFHCLELKKNPDLLFVFFFFPLIISFYLDGVHGMATSLVTSG